MFFDQKIAEKISYYYAIFFFFLMTCIGLDYCKKLNWTRKVTHQLRYSIAYTVHTPIKQYLKYYQQLFQANAVYQAHQQLQENYTQLKAQIQNYAEIKRENQQLHELLHSFHSSKKYHTTLARLLHVKINTQVCEILLESLAKIDKKKDLVILDQHGVVGRVIEIAPLLKVLRIDDKRSAVPVEIERNGLRGILLGQGLNQPLIVKYFSKTQDVRVGDKLITSGLGGIYPKGYLVSYITHIKNETDNFYLSISAAPMAALDKNHLLLILQTTI